MDRRTSITIFIAARVCNFLGAVGFAGTVIALIDILHYALMHQADQTHVDGATIDRLFRSMIIFAVGAIGSIMMAQVKINLDKIYGGKK